MGMSEKRSPSGSPVWLWPTIIYVGVIFVGNLVWEIGQLPMYTIWQDGTAWQQAIAVIHCTLGDVLIATSALLLALMIVGGREWPTRHFTTVPGMPGMIARAQREKNAPVAIAADQH
jgi:hypothetical protein